MKRYILYSILFVVLIIFLFFIGMQIRWSKMLSPGDLSLAHAELDLTEDCQACHTRGKQIDNAKCLDCHGEIQDNIDSGSGLHGHVSEECLDCHSEHHGLEIDIAYFDKERFDHAKTGWQLEGSHRLLRCEACHTQDTFLLDKTECVNCHEDFHDGEYGNDCGECHDQQTFRME